MTTGNSEYSFALADADHAVRMVVLGVGGMGNNAMENLARVGIPGLDLYSLNTDVQSLCRCRGSKPIQIGVKRTGGKGAGGDSGLGRLSAEDDVEKIRRTLKDAEIAFIASGMGGGTGTGAAPVIASICRDLGVLSICVVTMPMDCEGGKRAEKAKAGLVELRKQVDSLLIIENEKLSSVMECEDISIMEVFRRADKVVVDSVTAVARIINSHGYINLDLADLKKVLQRKSADGCVDAYIGVGEASGPDRSVKAAEMALDNPLMREASILGAANLLINVAGSDQMGHKEAMAGIKSIVDSAGNLEREIFMGVVPDNSMGEKLCITVIATGLRNCESSGFACNGSAKNLRQDEKMEVAPGSSCGMSIASDYAGLASTAQERKLTDILVSDVDYVAAKRGGDGNGYSPMIRKEEWEVPAYLRSQTGLVPLAQVAMENMAPRTLLVAPELNNAVVADDNVERIQYREALCNMAN